MSVRDEARVNASVVGAGAGAGSFFPAAPHRSCRDRCAPYLRHIVLERKQILVCSGLSGLRSHVGNLLYTTPVAELSAVSITKNNVKRHGRDHLCTKKILQHVRWSVCNEVPKCAQRAVPCDLGLALKVIGVQAGVGLTGVPENELL